jgi:hypothetical protein
MAGAERFGQFTHLYIEAFCQARCVDNFTAYRTAQKFVSDHLVPSVSQHVLELDGMLWAYSPASGAAGAQSHVVKKCLDPAGFS